MTIKTTTKTKPLTIIEAYDKFKSIIERLSFYEVDYTIRVMHSKKQIVLTSNPHCDSVKVAVPEFVIKFNEFSKRYAELVISYE